MIRTQDEDESIVTEIENVVTDGLPPISCIFCNFVTCIEFDMDNHLWGNHRIELFRLPIRGSLDLRIQTTIDEGKRAASTLHLNTTITKQPQDQIPKEIIKSWSRDKFKPIISAEKFFSNEQTLLLRNHSQSPCYSIINHRSAGKQILYSCDIHPKIKYTNLGGSIHLESIEHHCKYFEQSTHMAEIISRLSQVNVA